MENEIKGKYVVITSRFNCQSFPLGTYETYTTTNEDGVEETHEEFVPFPHLIFVSQEELDQIGKTKCFDLENNCVVDYDNTIDKIIEHKNELRSRRQSICFPIINRGQLWYDTLTDVQKEELKVWYKAWLNVTETLTEPVKPEWLK